MINRTGLTVALCAVLVGALPAGAFAVHQLRYLFAFHGGLLGDAVANLHRWIEHAAVIADLCESTEATDRGGGGECL